jgi:hypothetical protein
MKREEREEFKKWLDSLKFGQHHQNTTEYHRQHPHQVIIKNEDSWIMLFCIILTIGFLALLAKATI